MRLYDRDYSRLTADEEEQWQRARRAEEPIHLGRFKISNFRFREHPKPVRHFLGLFPNNYLDIVELQDEVRLKALLESFRQVVDSDAATERMILNFIIENRAYFIVGSLLKDYFSFGHHDAYLFPEFQLGNTYKVDHLLLGQNSEGWHLVLVELEAPIGKITLADGDLGSAFRKGLAQVGDWSTWLESRYATLSETFDKCKRRGAVLPQELLQLDSSRVHYVVIAGRRTDFTDKTYRIRRKRQKESAELILHYDNLIDAGEHVIGQSTY